MGGKESIRGYIYQALIAILECLNNDEWDQIKVEPLTKKEKVDIILQKSGITIKAIQVKSSINKFERPRIVKWFDELKLDIEAERYELVLVGKEFTEPAKEYIEENNKVSSDVIKRKEFDEVKLFKEVKMNVVEFLGRYCREREFTSNMIENMAKCLLTEFMLNGTKDKFLSKNDLINVLNNNMRACTRTTDIKCVVRKLGMYIGVLLWIFLSYDVTRRGIWHTACVVCSDIGVWIILLLMNYSDYYYENSLGEQAYEYYSAKNYGAGNKYLNVIVKKDNILHTQKILIENHLEKEITYVSGCIKFFSGDTEVNRVWFKKEDLGARRRVQIEQITYATDKEYIGKTYWDEVELCIDKIIVENREQEPWKGIVIKFYRIYNLKLFRYINIGGVRIIPYELSWLCNRILRPIAYALHVLFRASFRGYDLRNRWRDIRIRLVGFIKRIFCRIIGLMLLIGMVVFVLVMVCGQVLIMGRAVQYVLYLLNMVSVSM